MLRKTQEFIIFVTFEASGFPIPAKTAKSGVSVFRDYGCSLYKSNLTLPLQAAGDKL
jgi:hypothetical protein